MITPEPENGNSWRRFLPLILAFALGVCLASLIFFALPTKSVEEPGLADPASQDSPSASQDAPHDIAATFPSWNPDSEVLARLVAFVEAVCEPGGPSYATPEDRIATFDMDGTIISEKAPFYLDYMLLLHRVLDDPTYTADAETRTLCEDISFYAYRGKKNSDLSEGRHRASAAVFEGMTPEEYRAYVNNFLDTVEVTGFDGMTYGGSYYKPMVEVIEYLKANDFEVWMVSASQREIVRAVVERLGIEPDHVIANDLGYATTGQGSEGSLDYNMVQTEEIVLTTPLYDDCEKVGKSLAIAREIGKRPLLAFGNSSGDYSMLNYAMSGEGLSMLVIADDEEREYGDSEKAAEAFETAEKELWLPCSMKDDWATIYGEGVVKTALPTEEELELAEAA